MCPATWTAGSSFSAYRGPGIQGAAGGDLLGSPTLLPFQLLLGPGLCLGQVAGGGGSCLHSDPRSGFVLSGGPVPQKSWVRRTEGSGSLAGWCLWAEWGGWGLWLSHRDQPSLGQPCFSSSLKIFMLTAATSGWFPVPAPVLGAERTGALDSLGTPCHQILTQRLASESTGRPGQKSSLFWVPGDSGGVSFLWGCRAGLILEVDGF